VLTLLTDEQKERFSREKELDFSYNFEGKARFRANVFYERGRAAVALRLIPSKIRNFEELNLPLVLKEFTKPSQGFVLVTGPTGHGKTTTLAAMVNEINNTRKEHIVIIEDPIEYIFTHNQSLVQQRELHQDTLSFHRALRSILREDPNVVLIGEMRDLETIRSALTIAETGHLVFATLHTNSASQTVDRIIDVFPPHQQNQVRAQLAMSLTGVISQRLVSRIPEGRIVACEIMVVNVAVRNLIREGKNHQLESIIQTSAEEGMISLDKSLAELVQKGEITKEDALIYSIDPTVLESLIQE